MHPLISERLADLQSLCRRFRVRRLALFGSAARLEPVSKPRDFDLLVEFEPMLPVEHAGMYFGLLEELEDLLQTPVDLLEPGTIRNPHLQRVLDNTQVLLYAAA